MLTHELKQGDCANTNARCFNELKGDLKRHGVNDSNALANSLIDHPFHIATVTGDSVMLGPDDFGARIAFVDYDGKQAFDNYKKNPPKNMEEEIEFIKKNAPNMVKGIQMLKDYVKFIKSS